MTATTRRSGARGATVAGLLATAAGILVLRFSGVAMPPIPPGLVLLVAAAALVAFSPWRWAPAAGVLIALFEAVGYLASGSAGGLFALDSAGLLVGTWVRGIGIVVALVAGTAATVAAHRAPSPIR